MCAAPKGNQFWKLRSKHGRDKLFATPDLLWEAACEYFAYCDKHPWKVVKDKTKYRYCHFHYIIIVLVIGSRGYETLVVGYGSFRGTTILCLILTGFG